MLKILITGSAGLIGSEAVKFYASKGDMIIGIDNNMRAYFFGQEASTKENNDKNLNKFSNNYKHYSIDIRDKEKVEELFKNEGPFDIIIHTAAQPSHDWAAKEPFTDFEINANGTLNLLENFRKHSSKGVFIFTSTNKVYGDTPNNLPLIETEKRFEIDPNHIFSQKGINENMIIDNSKHSLFGASKAAADLLVQEYGKYFGLNTGIFRGGCLTGPCHSGTKLHGFLSYLVKCIVNQKPYTIIGYKGKQVRDNIHSYDLINAFDNFAKNPKKGEVYNIGGSRHSNISMLEAIELIEKLSGKKAIINYEEKAREGDHIWYISDVSKFKKDYPEWNYKYSINNIIKEIVDFEMKNCEK
jgi:CDP-paratose 2-epimerase